MTKTPKHLGCWRTLLSNRATLKGRMALCINENIWRESCWKMASYAWLPDLISPSGVMECVPEVMFGWMCALFALFTLVYWTQTRALASGRFKLENAWIRLKFASAFSLRTTWEVRLWLPKLRTSAFKIITLVHSIGFKVLFILLLQAFANTSPLLNELVGKVGTHITISPE